MWEDATTVFDRLLAIADRARARVQRIFEKAVGGLREQVHRIHRAVMDRVEARDAEGIARQARLDEWWEQTRNELSQQYLQMMVDASNVASERLNVRLNPAAPHVVEWINTRALALLGPNTDVEAVRAMIRIGAERGMTTEQIARMIEGHIGLHPRQAQALLNYRSALAEGGYSGQRLTNMVDSYGRRLLRYRAKMIARTETVAAVNGGVDALWRQAAATGKVDGTKVRRFWVVTADDRLCPDCAATPSLNRSGQPLGRPFNTPAGWADSPPQHPMCRCGVRYTLTR